MALPEGFLAEIAKHGVLSPLASDLLTAPEASVRVNPAKPVVIDGTDGAVPWCPLGVYLSERPQFTFDPRLHQGCYYVQDASSMAVTAAIGALALESPVRYLDACAAPGGKTTAALSVLPEGSAVVANEYDFRRAEILAENIAKWGASNVMVTRGDTRGMRKLRGLFDIVAVDAPCSGEGMMRKEPKAVEQWSPGLVRECAELQREILGNVWDALRPGGHLIYSTCTFNLHENEENIAWLVDTYGAEPLPIPALEALPQVAAGIDTPHPCYRFLPGRVRGEGLFLALLRKPGEARPTAPQRQKAARKADKTPPAVRSWINGGMSLRADGDDIYAVPESCASFFEALSPHLSPIATGTHIATVKGKDIIPTHTLALATALNRDAFPRHEVDLATALAYLRRDSVTLPEGTDKGYILLTYAGLPLGFVKNLGNRTNNLYPKTWRIRAEIS